MTVDRPARPLWRVGLLLLAAVGFVLANLVNALNKGGDFQVFVESGRRVLERLPLYEGSSAGVGVVGPPFQGLFFTPFALLAAIGMPLARVAWYAVGVASLVGGVALWSAALDRRERGGTNWQGCLASAAVLVPLLAILFPAQTNFEHQNMNPLLLVVLGAGAYALRVRRDAWAGAFIGAATALKAYPGLLILYLAYRRAWRALAAAVATATILSLSPAVVYGPRGLVELFDRWLAFSTAGGWPSVGNNQSLVAMIERSVGIESSLVGPLYAASVLLLLIGFVWATHPTHVTNPTYPTHLTHATHPTDLALLTLVAVLASPIAWDHYWVLMFPAFYVAYNSRVYRASAVARAVFWIALVLTTGVSRNTLGLAGFELARNLSNSTWAALLLFALTLAARRGHEARALPET